LSVSHRYLRHWGRLRACISSATGAHLIKSIVLSRAARQRTAAVSPSPRVGSPRTPARECRRLVRKGPDSVVDESRWPAAKEASRHTDNRQRIPSLSQARVSDVVLDAARAAHCPTTAARPPPGANEAFLRSLPSATFKSEGRALARRPLRKKVSSLSGLSTHSFPSSLSRRRGHGGFAARLRGRQ